VSKSENLFGSPKPLVAILMGSDSDWPIMQGAAEALEKFQIPYRAEVLSAHRTPSEMIDFGKAAESRGLKILIAGAGGAAHLPGMLASVTSLPVVGVPVSIGSLQGQDALLSIVQMPKGVPVATVAINGAYNAGILATQILATGDSNILARLKAYKAEIAAASKKKTLQ
jgi:5-(carboxyamino)imidazole ribonucleotide mutase